ncbi:YhcH/YjgK/YiaL family protein [Vibrio alginolyticus]|uniref:YhcH/YjgK/YiaL family protein n=1 Tax=Vibrio alginolyticus TaxID=663 RepID=UPI001BD2B834|nr:YhcH/YjgK/YiaL family protein [Vibrio alginolyticus]EME9802039.1 YhcH/YjgK/YiaL family protein [Vibrio alginolyticus]MBS9837486.1 YhcH/YjgK/YiaL family protein [Vibrio alginolyticus]
MYRKEINLSKCNLTSEVFHAIQYSVSNFSRLNNGEFKIPNSSIYGCKICYKIDSVKDNKLVIYERHVRTIDLHYVVKGKEVYSLIEDDKNLKVDCSDISKDYELSSPHQEQSLSELNTNQCMVIGTGIWHMFRGEVSKTYREVEKFVLKIPSDIMVFYE